MLLLQSCQHRNRKLPRSSRAFKQTSSWCRKTTRASSNPLRNCLPNSVKMTVARRLLRLCRQPWRRARRSWSASNLPSSATRKIDGNTQSGRLASSNVVDCVAIARARSQAQLHYGSARSSAAKRLICSFKPRFSAIRVSISSAMMQFSIMACEIEATACKRTKSD